MDAPLLTTKLSIPYLRTARVIRENLIARLTGDLWQGARFSRKLTLVCAPAGYGKTTLVTEWLHQLSIGSSGAVIDGGTAWLSLDDGDNDPAVFLSYIIAAIQGCHPGFGITTRGLLQSPQPPPGDVILTTLLNEIAALSSPIILVLDDYQFIQSPAIHQQLATLLERLPAVVHLVLVTREDPLLPLARLRARGQMLEIRG